MTASAATSEDIGRLLRTVELAVERRLDGLLQGDYQGLLPGHGSELGEARPYAPGDDVRRIDWTVTARTQLPHVRDTIADHELETTVVIDRSASSGVGTRRRTPARLGLEVAAALGLLVARGGNRFGLLTLGDGKADWVPHRSGRAHVHGAIRRAARVEPSGEVDLAAGLRQTSRVATRRGLVVVVSDLLGQDAAWIQGLRRIAARHSVIVVELNDPLGRELPDVGYLTVVDAESGRRRVVDTSRRDLRNRYAEAAERRSRERAVAVRRTGADHLVLSTDSDWVGGLISHLELRRRHRVRRTVTR